MFPADFVAVPANECPCTNADTSGCDLQECSYSMSINALCEADQTLPDGNTNWETDQCPGTYDVYRFTGGNIVLQDKISNGQD